MFIIAVVAFLAASTAATAAQPATALPTMEQALARAQMLFCMPLVGKEATNTDEIARGAGYKPTTLPNFSGLKVRSAPAWLAPSASGRVVVSRGSADERVPLSCEITVSGASGAQLSKKFAEFLVCQGCPFVRNAQASQERSGIRMDKYDWKMPEKKALLSVLTIALPDNSPINFYSHTHMVR